MSEIDELRYRIGALERDIYNYRVALEELLYDTEIKRVERGHAWIHLFLFVGALLFAAWIVKWFKFDAWFIEVPVTFAAFFGSFIIAFLLIEKPMQREIDRISRPLSSLPKPHWAKSND